jgi:hypothetical protein
MEETPPDMEGSCEYIKLAVAESREGLVLQLEGWTAKKYAFYEKSQEASDLSE